MIDGRLIVALDLPFLKEAQKIVRLLSPIVSFYKIGMRLFTAAGPEAVKMVQEAGGKVFLDLKFHDIPNTVAEACDVAVGLGISMLNVHASGGREMLQAATKAVRGRAILIGVTVLTSESGDSKDRVVELAKLCQESGLGGIVCSPHETKEVRKICGDQFVIVTPGVRPEFYSKSDDQRRTATPKTALTNGATYIVVGRPILEATDPLGAAKKLLEEIASTEKR